MSKQPIITIIIIVTPFLFFCFLIYHYHSRDGKVEKGKGG